MKHPRLLAGVSALALIAGAVLLLAAPLAADPKGPKDCGSILPPLPAPKPAPPETAAAAQPVWAQRGGTVNDASCLDRTPVAGVVAPRSEAEVAGALAFARARGLTVSAAGVKHSMGGQAFQRGGLVLDMRAMNAFHLDRERRTVTVGGGATWHDIQKAIHPDFAVKAMQSTDIFTVGGSISVNAHGMDHRAGAVLGSIRSLRVMLANGTALTVSPTENEQLFRHVVGGYGLFAVILSAELEVVPNDVYRSERAVIAYRDFPALYRRIEADPSVRLMYAHLSTSPGSLLDETLVYTYRRVDSDQGLERAPLGEVGSTKMRRLTVNLAKHGALFQRLKWWSEKTLEHRFESCTITRAQAMGDGEACLVSRNDPMHDSVAYLRNALRKETDILHEYFIPRDRLIPFLDGLRRLVRTHDANLLNASIRAVDSEPTALSYAPDKAFSVVLYLNQKTNDEGNRRMARLTSDLIDLASDQGGRFFLPYQLHYTAAQLQRAYPEIGAFFAAKRDWDPGGLFGNSWYARYAPQIASEEVTSG